MSIAQSLNSLGFVCQLLQRPAREVMTAAAQLNMQPVVYLDTRPQFSDHQTETLRQHFEQKQEASNG
jgi:hypothetical protein